jgi:GntR family transcriptional regulator, transcriptional repressor for pyruvate dehydrogenase complex
LFGTLEQWWGVPPIARASVPDQVFHRLAREIVSGRLAPGDRLPAQRALAAELGVNMASIREGVKRLE